MLKKIELLTLLVMICAGASSAASAQDADLHERIVKMWLGSGHADAQASAFTHWNGEEAIPGSCAMCHSGEGFRDFHGLDGTASGSIENVIAPGGVVDCATCHVDGVGDIGPVTFPSGVQIDNPGPTATCMACHQGRAAGSTVAAATADIGDDIVNSELRFINPHYKPAAATLLGSDVGGGYEYPGKIYMGRFQHVPDFSDCTDCHSPHSLEVKVEDCAGCHAADNPQAIRASKADFDGDGDTTSGIHTEIAALSGVLLDAIEAYAGKIVQSDITYVERYPYFMQADGAGGPYGAWTPRLLRAAYNYQFVTKDPGAYAHNPHYAVQLLHDSIMDVSAELGMSFAIGERPG